jgi:hypothetical protein
MHVRTSIEHFATAVASLSIGRVRAGIVIWIRGEAIWQNYEDEQNSESSLQASFGTERSTFLWRHVSTMRSTTPVQRTDILGVIRS